MRVPTLLGIALIIAGAYFLIQGGGITTKREVINVGPLQVSAEEQHPIQPWVSGLAIVAGIALVVAGVRTKA